MFYLKQGVNEFVTLYSENPKWNFQLHEGSQHGKLTQQMIKSQQKKNIFQESLCQEYILVNTFTVSPTNFGIYILDVVKFTAIDVFIVQSPATVAGCGEKIKEI